MRSNARFPKSRQTTPLLDAKIKKKTLYSHRAQIRSHVGGTAYGDDGDKLIEPIIHTAALAMNDPAGLINVAIEALTQSNVELPAYHHNNYRPLLWRTHATHRSLLFRMLELLRIESTIWDNALIDAWHYLSTHRNTERVPGIADSRAWNATSVGAKIVYSASGLSSISARPAVTNRRRQLSARTEEPPHEQAARLFEKVIAGQCSMEETDAFRGHTLTEMTCMSLDDGLIMQIHPGAARSHHRGVAARHGRD